MNRLQEISLKYINGEEYWQQLYQATDVQKAMKEYAEYCMNELKDEILYGSIHITYGDGDAIKNEIEQWIKDFKHD